MNFGNIAVLVTLSGMVSGYAEAGQKTIGEQRFQEFLLKNSVGKSKISRNVEHEPVRFAKLRTKIYKDKFIQKPNGEFEFQRTTICEKMAEVPVFDNRNGNSSNSAPVVSCPNVALYAQISYRRDQLWENETPVDYKQTSFFLFGGEEVDSSGVGSFSATRDLMRSNEISVIRPAVMIDCDRENGETSNCQSSHPEFYWAFAELEDKQ